MAFNGNYVSIDTVLQEVRRYPFTEGITKREAAHGLASLLQLIGSVIPMERTYKDVLIKDHKGKLPNDILYLHGVRNLGNSCKNKGIPMSYASDIYHSALHSDEARAKCDGTSIDNPEKVKQIYPPTAPDDANWIDDSKPVFWSNALPYNEFYDENSYTINGTAIDTSFTSGYVRLAYDAIKTDDDGFPLIPDDASFRNAFKYYLLKREVEPAFYSGDVRRDVYADINTQYDFYVGQAQNSFNMPNYDQVQTMINGLVRILPSTNNSSDGWKSFNKKENF